MKSVAVLLAAGESERMGAPKVLLDWHGQPLLHHQLHQVQKSDLDECVVVLGRDYETLAPLVRRPFRPGWKARPVRNPRFREGKCTSIRVGLASLLARPDAILIVSVDQPLDHRLVDALLLAGRREWAASGEAAGRTIILPAFEGRRGHPPLFRGALLPELLGVQEETLGLRTIVRRLPERVLEIPWNDPRILLNLNTTLDLSRATGADTGRAQPRV
jgi:molybdenum cofactor cytidylyltransferase